MFIFILYHYYIMEKSTIIRLRQAESSTTNSNGDYQVSLKEGVNIEEGDQVRVHSVILDTATESVINIDKKIRVKMGVAKYITNYKFNEPLPYVVEQDSGDPTIPMPDLKNYYLATLHDLTGSTNYLVQGLVVSTLSTDILRGFGDFESVWEYYEAGTNKYKTINIYIPPFKIIDHLDFAVEVPFGPDNKGIIISGEVKGKYFKLIHPSVDHRGDLPNRTEPWNQRIFNVPAGQKINPKKDNLDDSTICFGNGGNPISDASAIMNLYEEECSFVIPAGQYEPAEMAQIFNDNMTQIDSLGTIGNNFNSTASPPKYEFPVNNPFLTTFGQAGRKMDLASASGSTALYLNPNITADAPTATNLLKPTPPTEATADRFIGGSQISMNFDTNLKKINFDSLHFPAYVGSGTIKTPGIDFPSGNLNPVATPPVPVPLEPIVSYGGSAFTSFEAFEIVQDADTTQTPPLPEVLGDTSNLFSQLGIQNMTIDVGHDDQPITLLDSSTVYPLLITDVIGQNITGALATIDIAVPKTVNYATPVSEATETALTTPLLSTRTFDQSDNDEGYYLIDIGVKLPQKMIGGFEGGNGVQTTSNKIQAVIGKFYTAGNFLQSQGQGEVVYTHVGEPQMLNDLEVRVLHPDFSPPSNEELGPLNSIFLEVVKPVKVNGK